MRKDNVVTFENPAKSTFEEAAARYVLEHQHKRSILRDVEVLKSLMPFIGHLTLEAVHMGTLQMYIQTRKKDGVKERLIMGYKWFGAF